MAWDDAKAIAREMLEDEGMQFESKKVNEGKVAKGHLAQLVPLGNDTYKVKYMASDCNQMVSTGAMTREEATEMARQLNKDMVDESVNEDSLLTGGATVPNDPDFANPQKDNEPGIKKEQEAEMTDSPEEPKEDERDIPLEGDKEYLGNRGGEEYFYFVIIPAEDGTKDLQIQTRRLSKSGTQ